MNINGLTARYRDQRNPKRTERRVELVCIAAGALLLLQLGFLTWHALVAPSPEPVAPAAGLLAVGDLAERGAVNQRDSAELTARPLFWESRRPMQAVAEAPKAAPEEKSSPKLKGLTLHGVFGTDDSQGIIATVEGKRQRLMEGDSVSGWRLQRVEREEVEFISGANSQVVRLKRVETGIQFENVPRESAGQAPASSGSDKKKQAQEQPEGELVLGGRR